MGDLKLILKKRLLDEMLGSVKDSDWSVLIMDAVTTKVMSSVCRISEVLDYGVSLVENVSVKREPLPKLAGVYFITPSAESVARVVEDFQDAPLYKTAHVFFSSPAGPHVLAAIRACPGLTSRLRNLKEVNLELQTVDRRTFVTGEAHALKALFGEHGTASASYKVAVGSICTRLAGLFASLKEHPAIRFRAGKPGGGDDVGAGLETQALVSQRVALELHERLGELQAAGQLPEGQTCDLIILDRGCDAVAPVIHEWTYEAMAYDLLGIQGNTFRYEAETAGGKMEQKEHILDERDKLWVELRHQHFAGASLLLTRLMDDFKTKHAGYRGGQGGAANGPDMRQMRSLVQQLPQYREQLARLAVHIELAGRINAALDARDLVDLGRLEQDLVFGDATSKEVINFLSNHAAVPASDKARLLACYAITHPEKLDAAKQAQWQKLARLRPDEMGAILNLEHLGVPVRKRGKAAGLVFGRKRKRAVRKEREAGEDEEQYALSRFVPLLQEVLEDHASSALSTDDYPYVSAPPLASARSAAAPAASPAPKAGSVRSNRGAVGWAKKAAAAPAAAIAGLAGYSNGSANPKAGRRTIVYVIGGITHSEMRAAHKMSAKLGRDIIIGGTSLDIPNEFLEHLKELGEPQAGSTFEIDANNNV